MSLSINSYGELPPLQSPTFPGYAPAKPVALGQPGQPEQWHGDVLNNLRLEGHLENFSQSGNAPSLQRFASAWGLKDEKPAPALANHLEQRETEVESRYEKQQEVFHSGMTGKRKLGTNIRLGIHLFNNSSRKYRTALRELTKANNGKDENAKGSTMAGLIETSQGLTGNIRPLLDMSQQVKDQDKTIQAAEDMVRKEELAPDDIADNSANQGSLTSRLQNQIHNRDVASLDPSAALDQAHWEKDWAAGSADEMLALMEEGNGLMGSIIRKNQEEERAQQSGQSQPKPGQDKSFSTLHQNDISYQRIVTEEANLKSALGGIKAN